MCVIYSPTCHSIWLLKKKEIFWAHLFICIVHSTTRILHVFIRRMDFFWDKKRRVWISCLTSASCSTEERKCVRNNMRMSEWDLTVPLHKQGVNDFGRVTVGSWCLDWTGQRVWEWRTQDSCWLVLHCQVNQLMSAWSISLSSSQRRQMSPAQNQPNLMGMMHREWRPKFTSGKIKEICKL